MLGSLLTSAARASRSVRVWRSALLFAGALGLAVISLQSTPAAHASTALHYQRGYYLDNGWYCYGWSNGAYHCTAHWHRTASGQLVSDNPAWVPNSAATSGSSSSGGSRGGGTHPTSGGGGVSTAPAGIGSCFWSHTAERAAS